MLWMQELALCAQTANRLLKNWFCFTLQTKTLHSSHLQFFLTTRNFRKILCTIVHGLQFRNLSRDFQNLVRSITTLSECSANQLFSVQTAWKDSWTISVSIGQTCWVNGSVVFLPELTLLQKKKKCSWLSTQSMVAKWTWKLTTTTIWWKNMKDSLQTANGCLA